MTNHPSGVIVLEPIQSLIIGINEEEHKIAYLYYCDIEIHEMEDLDSFIEKKFVLEQPEVRFRVQEPSNLIDAVNYFYSGSNRGDLLTSLNGDAITYDTIGNPLNYLNGFSFTWTGRRLTGATNYYKGDYSNEEAED